MKTMMSIKIDKSMKDEATKLAGEMGLSLSSVINANLRQFVSERRVVFSVEPELNSRSKSLLKEALHDVRHKKNLIGPFAGVVALKKSLLG